MSGDQSSKSYIRNLPDSKGYRAFGHEIDELWVLHVKFDQKAASDGFE